MACSLAHASDLVPYRRLCTVHSVLLRLPYIRFTAALCATFFNFQFPNFQCFACLLAWRVFPYRKGHTSPVRSMPLIPVPSRSPHPGPDLRYGYVVVLQGEDSAGRKAMQGGNGY